MTLKSHKQERQQHNACPEKGGRRPGGQQDPRLSKCEVSARVQDGFRSTIRHGVSSRNFLRGRQTVNESRLTRKSVISPMLQPALRAAVDCAAASLYCIDRKTELSRSMT